MIEGNLASVPAMAVLGVTTIVRPGVLLPSQAKGGSSRVRVYWVSPSAAAAESVGVVTTLCMLGRGT